VRGNRELNLDLTLLSLGTYLELPVTDQFHVLCEAGLSLGIAAAGYSFESATTLSGLGTQDSRGRNSSTAILPGAYLGLGAAYNIDDHWAIIANARFQYMNSFNIIANDTEATLRFDSAFVLSLGCVYSF
jgi:opacity protein-like surface antigen